MPVEEVQHPLYRITGKGIDHLLFTGTSSVEDIACAKSFCNTRGAVIASPGELLDCYFEMTGNNSGPGGSGDKMHQFFDVGDHLITRMCAAYVRVDTTICVGVYESHNTVKNLLLKRAEEGCNAQREKGYWQLPFSDQDAQIVMGYLHAQNAWVQMRAVRGVHSVSGLNPALQDDPARFQTAPARLFSQVYGKNAPAYHTCLMGEESKRFGDQEFSCIIRDHEDLEARLPEGFVEIRVVKIRFRPHLVCLSDRLDTGGMVIGVRHLGDGSTDGKIKI